jgi:rod shape-determining protein MreB and related proteins
MSEHFRFTSSANIAIDLGNSNTIVTNNTYTPLSHPSFIAFNTKNNAVKAVGKEAYDMAGKTNQSLKVIKPLKGGVIKDFESTQKMLEALVDLAHSRRLLFNRFSNIVSGVPYSTTEVERRALRDTLSQFSASQTFLLFEPIAAAIGMGINIQQPNGNLIVDIGGGITEVVVISLSGIVNFNSVKTAGDTFDTDIQDHFRKNCKMEIGTHTAEQIKIRVGAALDQVHHPPQPMYVVGKDIVTGIPKRIQITHQEVSYILNSSLSKIEQAIIQTLEECPPELAGDIYENGIYLTGGGSLLRGLKERIQEKIKVPIHQDPNALLSVTRGILTALSDLEKYQYVLIK